MKKKIAVPEQKQPEQGKKNTISRKEAIKKTGFMALSAASMLLLLNSPAKASASPAPPPRDNEPHGKGHGPWKK